MLFLCEFPILFSIVKLKLGHNFSQFIHRFKIWIFKCWSWSVYTSKFFPIHKSGEKLEFLKSLDCTTKFFPIRENVWKLGFLKSPCLYLSFVFQYDMWRQERRSQFMIKLSVFKQRFLYHNVGNKFVSVKSWKYCFET